MIYIGFSSPKKKKVGSELIKWWIGRPYSHVYIRFESSRPVIPSAVYHAAHGSVHFMSQDRFLTENTIYSEFKFDVSESQRSEILAWCISMSGESYGYCELLKIFFMDLAHRLNIPLAFHDGKGYICSELVGEVLKTHFSHQFKKPMYSLSPKDIEDAIFDIYEANLGKN